MRFIRRLGRRTVRRCQTVLDRLMIARARRGPYRYLVGDWARISDVELATRALDTEFFRGPLKPLPLPVTQVRSILFLAPHQDDEAIGAGGTLYMAAQAGVKVTVAYVTDGIQLGTRFPYTPEELKQVRHDEAAECCRIIGAEMRELGLYNPCPHPTIENVAQLAEWVRELKPDVIMAPWLLDLPSKHRIPNHLLWLADQKYDLPNCEIWGYQVHNTPVPNGYVDVTEVADKKLEMLRCFRSQLDYYGAYDHMAMGMSAWNARFLKPEPRERHIEIFFTLPFREMMNLIERYYFLNIEMTYQSARDVIPGMIAIHKEITGQAPPTSPRYNKASIQSAPHLVTQSPLEEDE